MIKKLFFCARFSVLIILMVALVTLMVRGQTQETPLPLTKSEFSGLKNVSRDQSIAASGLQIGGRVNKGDLDKAAKELSASGLFSKVQYKYRRYDDRFEVTFTVEESGSSMAVTFDNFVWFTDKELTDAVRQEFPGFNGTAPDGEGAIKSIKKALTKLLQDRKLPGEVDYVLFSGDAISSKTTEHVFSVKGVSIPICSVHYLKTE